MRGRCRSLRTVRNADYVATRSLLTTVQERGPQTLPVDRAVELLNRALEQEQEGRASPKLRKKIESVLAYASDLLCHQQLGTTAPTTLADRPAFRHGGNL